MGSLPACRAGEGLQNPPALLSSWSRETVVGKSIPFLYPSEDRNIIHRIGFAWKRCFHSWCNHPTSLAILGSCLNLLCPRYKLLFICYWNALKTLYSEGLQIVGTIMPGDGRKVFLELPGLLPPHTVFPGPQIPVFLHRVWPLSGCWGKGTCGFTDHRKWGLFAFLKKKKLRQNIYCTFMPEVYIQ